MRPRAERRRLDTVIDFPCPCGKYSFSMPDDMAGSMVQCPRCKRLVDVPLLSDLPNLDEDGVYKIEEPSPPPDSEEIIAKASLAFTRSHYDDEGNEIDLRTNWRDLEKVGNPEDRPLEFRDDVPADRPRYDPTTGELIRPVDVKSDGFVDPKSVPVAPRAAMPPPVVIDDDHPDFLHVLSLPLRLFKPINVIVMGFILLAHLLIQFFVGVVSLGFWLVLLFIPIFNALLMAHYANVVEESGPVRRNELPTPLRNLSWHDDTWGPFWRMLVALALCYGPAWGTLFLSRLPEVVRVNVALALAIAGSIAAPAAILTSTTSGSFLNLRPDRLIGVMKTCGLEYLLSLALWVVTVLVYDHGTNVLYLRTRGLMFDLVVGPTPGAWSVRYSWVVGYACLIAGIYGMHLFCWHLGLFYRRYHEKFPWLFQRYERGAKNRIAPQRGFTVKRVRRVPHLPAKPAPAPPPAPIRDIP